MPELLSVHGRCPRCGQVLTLPAGQLQGVFRCARCQYRVLGAALVDEARATPPRLSPLGRAPVLRPFEEQADDERTRVLVPGSGGDEQSEVPLAAILTTGSSSTPPRTELARFDAEADDDQHTRLHVASSFDEPEPGRTRSSPAPAPLPTAGGRSSSPAPVLASAAPLTRVGSGGEAEEATRLHLPGDLDGKHSALAPARDQTLLGVAPAANPPPAPAAPLTRFDADDSDDQRTRLQVPISYEDEEPPAAPLLRPLVAPRRSPASVDSDPELLRPSLGRRFGRASLVFTRWIDEWVNDHRGALLSTLALLSAIIAPAFDAAFASPRRAATVIAANIVLFFLWTLFFAWLGKVRNDDGQWDPRIAWLRSRTAVRLTLEDLQRSGALPWPLKWRVTADVSRMLGLLGLGAASVLTITQLVWSAPADSAPLVVGRAASGMILLLSVVASRQAASVALGFVPSELAAPAVARFPAVVDLSLPLSLDPAHAATPVHQLLEVLSQWQPREWQTRDSYLAEVERLLLRNMGFARVERERWLGTERAQGIAPLLINDSVLVEVMRGFDAEAAERVVAKMRLLAKVWRGKPAVIVIFDASRADLLGGDASSPLEALHQAYPMLAVRMPSARPSLA